MKILVTGANGYIGSKVVSRLLDDGHTVYAVDFSDNHIDKRAKIFIMNIFDGNDYYSFFDKPDVCLHLAWRDGFVHNSSAHIEDLSSHFLFLKKLIDSGIKQIAVMGTMHEAGYFEGKLDSLTNTNPLSLYGIAKDSLRRALFNYCENKNCNLLWLRAFYIYGDDKFGNSIFCKIRAAFESGKKTFPLNSGKNEYDFIHIDELVKQIAHAVAQSKILGEVNVCSGKPISLSTMVEKYIFDNNIQIKLEYGVYPDRPYDSPCIYGDNEKIRKIEEMYDK